MLWALVFLSIYARPVVPEYVQLYKTREECVKHIVKSTGAFDNQKMYCAPVSSTQ